MEVNQAYADLVGRTLEELRVLTFDEFTHPDDLEIERPLVAQVLAGERPFYTLEKRYLRPDGSAVWARVTASVFRAGGEPHGIVVVEDLTERRKIEQRLQQSQRLESVGRLAGGIAHDFNNLLTAISGYSELLLAGLERGDPRRQDASEISLAATRAAALTRQLLRFARRQQPEPTDVDLDEIVRGLEPMLTRLLGEGVELRLTLSGGSLVRADPGHLEQVIVNLVLNGRDAMPDGGLISIETAAGAAGVVLRVRDSGLGMEEETRAQVFEPFFTTKSVSEGTGLGLATVFGIVKGAGGEIEVETAPGKGSTFLIRFSRSGDAESMGCGLSHEDERNCLEG